MTRLLQTLVRICVFRDGPQDLPAARATLLGILALGWAASVMLIGALASERAAVVDVSVATATGLVFTWLALLVRGHPGRLTQTATALFGTDLVFLIPTAPLLLVTTGREAPSLQLVLLVLWLWTIAVKGHIFRHALDLPLPGGVLVALAYTLLSLLLTGA